MSIVIRKGTASDLDAFVQLLQEVHRRMDRADWFYLDPPEVFREQMESGEMDLWLAMDGDCVVGCLDILRPGLKSHNYGYYLNYAPEQLLQTVNMDTAAVHPDYRGRGLQKRLLREAEAWLGTEEDRYLLCTIHPENRFSLHNALVQGYTIRAEIPIYGSRRYLLEKRLKKQENNY